MYKTIILSIIFCSSFILSAVAQNDWKFMTEKDGIKVYAKAVPESKVKALKVECVINASAAQLVALLLDVKAAERWVSHTKSCTLLKKVSDAELYYYSE